ncbi:hypothetical protein [Thiolinea disciformis]|uniref:hypothetical protein n=1 Tax=Thiolinea disciformis TaxID=125614 RepID=UPI000376D304|nr:hypothetical protein [Thiolinea disciformis]
MGTFSRTVTATKLSSDGMRVRLLPPSALAVCQGHVVPYTLPDAKGGYIVFAEYGDPLSQCNEGCAPGCKKPTAAGGCGCGGGCSGTKDATEANCKVKGQASGELLRYEVVKFSGYAEDGVTLLIEKRAVKGWADQEWPAGTIVMQGATGEEYDDLQEQINKILGMGCLLAIEALSCGDVIKKDQFRCVNGCLRYALRDVVIGKDYQYPVNKEATNDWSKCYSINELMTIIMQFVNNSNSTLPACPPDAYRQKIIDYQGSLAAIASYCKSTDHAAGTNIVGSEWGGDIVDTKTWTKADLVTLGMRTCDNAVIVRTEVSCDIQQANTVATANSEANVGVILEGLYRQKYYSGDVSVLAGASNTNDRSQRIYEHTIPVTANGSVTAKFTTMAIAQPNLGFLHTAYCARIVGFCSVTT